MRLLGYQYAQEMKDHNSRSTEWVLRLPAVLAAMNFEETRLTGKKPRDAMKKKSVTHLSSSVIPGCKVGLKRLNCLLTSLYDTYTY